MTHIHTFKNKYNFKRPLLTGLRKITFLLLSLLAVTPLLAKENSSKNLTENTLTSIISLTNELFQKCPKMEEGLEQCMNQVLRQRGCKTNNPWIQDESALDDIKKYGFVTMSGAGQCITNTIFSRVVEDLEGDSYFLEFTLKQKPTSEEIKNLKVRKRFNSVNEYERDGLIFDISKNGPDFSFPETTRVLVGTPEAWKAGEFTFAKYFTLGKTDSSDIKRIAQQEKAMNHLDIYSLVGGKGKIQNLKYDSKGKLAQIKTSIYPELAKTLSNNFTKKIGEPEAIIDKVIENQNSYGRNYLLAWLEKSKNRKEVENLYSKCKSNKFGYIEYSTRWANNQVEILDNSFRAVFCVGQPSLRAELPAVSWNTITFTSPSYLWEKEKEEEIKKLKQEEEGKRKMQKEQEEISKLF